MRSSLRDRLQGGVLLTATLLLAGLLVARFHERRPPWFAVPETLLDHAGPEEHEARYALIMIERAREIVPRGKEVTCFRPVNGKQQYDSGSFLAAAGLLPDHVVLPPFTASDDSSPPIEYVIAVRGPFDHARYTRIAEFPEGAIYRAPR